MDERAYFATFFFFLTCVVFIDRPFTLLLSSISLNGRISDESSIGYSCREDFLPDTSLRLGFLKVKVFLCVAYCGFIGVFFSSVDSIMMALLAVRELTASEFSSKVVALVSFFCDLVTVSFFFTEPSIFDVRCFL